ncbi:hypothetical protein RI054_12g60380 [Pseudoscourfieldia marina]
MNDIAGEVVQQLQAMQADDDALLALEILARRAGAALAHSDPYASLRCQHQRGQKMYVVTVPWRMGVEDEKDNELCFRADEAHLAIRYLLLAAPGPNDSAISISFFNKVSNYETQLLQVKAQPGDEDIEAVRQLLPIIESARHLLTDA